MVRRSGAAIRLGRGAGRALVKIGWGCFEDKSGAKGVSPLTLAAALCADRLASILFVSLPQSRRVACARIRAKDPGGKETPPPARMQGQTEAAAVWVEMNG